MKPKPKQKQKQKPKHQVNILNAKKGTELFNPPKPPKTSVIHYTFCYFIASTLIAIKKDLFNNIIYEYLRIRYESKIRIKKNIDDAHELDESSQRYINIKINIIDILTNFIIIGLIIIFVFFKKKYILNKAKKLFNFKL